ncbi:hypothetical protein ACIRQP_37760 [Streptomyces sp. NPDC102274]|uniref:hypothetical protein n=1 Tax=Streptomyces sp. NPDC102274 TaxID=3366151 RepID=UPI00380FA81B
MGESTHYYTAREIAAIELTEAVTVLKDGFARRGVSHGHERFRRDRVGLVVAITTINARNRFDVSTRPLPGYHTPAT